MKKDLQKILATLENKNIAWELEKIIAAVPLKDINKDAKFFMKELSTAIRELDKAFKSLYTATIKIDSCRYIQEVGPIADKMHEVTESFDRRITDTLQKIVKYLEKIDAENTKEEGIYNLDTLQEEPLESEGLEVSDTIESKKVKKAK